MSTTPTVITPLPADALLHFLVQITLLLLVAVLLGRVAARVRMPPIVGELCAGVLLGPSVLGHLAPGLSSSLAYADPQQQHLLEAVGQIGVLLLVGITGVHIDLTMPPDRKAAAVRVSTAGFMLPLGLGVWLGLLLPATVVPAGTSRTTFALFLGVALGISSIPVIAKTLLDMRLLHRDIGQLTMCSVMLDDIVGWTLLAVVSAMATTGLHPRTFGGIVIGLLVITVAAVALTPVVRRILHDAGRAADPATQTTAVICVLVLLGAAGTQAVGLEAVFGAFVAGLMVSRCRSVDIAMVTPLRTTVQSVLAPVFFALAGLRMDLTALSDGSVLVTGAVVLVVATVSKFAGAYLGARISRLGHWEGLALGAGMNARGVIEVIIAMVGLRLGVLSPQIYTIIILVAIATSLMAPPTLGWAMSRLTETEPEMARSKSLRLE